MKIIDIFQGTEDWHAWRDGKVGASDAPTIMGDNPFKTRLKLWNEKSGVDPTHPPNIAMIHGQRTEKEAREACDQELGIKFKPTCVEHPDHDWMIASLDGLSECGKFIVEIKCPLKEERHLDTLMSGKVPRYYFAQVQHQLAVTGLDMAYFYSYYDGEGILIEVKRDDEYIRDLITAEKEFIQSILDGIPPKPSDKDYVENDSLEWIRVASEFKDVKEQIKSLQEKENALKDNLISMANEKLTRGSGVTVYKVVRKGTVDIKLLESSTLINVDDYRKPETTSWAVR